MYFRRPSNISNGGREIPPGSGEFYVKKSKQYILNPNWNKQKFIEEIANADAIKIPIGIPEVSLPRFGKNIQHISTRYKSFFSDGTEIEFIYKNYDKDPVTGLVRYDHLGLMKIK